MRKRRTRQNDINRVQRDYSTREYSRLYDDQTNPYRRRFHDERDYTKKLITYYSGRSYLTNQPARVSTITTYKDQTGKIRIRSVPHFIDSRRVLVCRQRAKRRRVLFAIRKIIPGAGNGGRILHKFRRRNKDSNIQCHWR